jgi:hypothetical protein
MQENTIPILSLLIGLMVVLVTAIIGGFTITRGKRTDTQTGASHNEKSVTDLALTVAQQKDKAKEEADAREREARRKAEELTEKVHMAEVENLKYRLCTETAQLREKVAEMKEEILSTRHKVKHAVKLEARVATLETVTAIPDAE